MKCWCRTSLIFCLASLQAGCSESPSGQQAEDFSAIQLVNQIQDEASNPRLATLIPSSNLFEAPRQEKLSTPGPAIEAPTFPPENEVWAIHGKAPLEDLIELPPVDITPTTDAPQSSSPATQGGLETFQPIASLLPPEPLDLGLPNETTDPTTKVAPEKHEIAPVISSEVNPKTTEKELIATIIRNCTAATTGVLTDERVNQIAKKKIRAAYAIANRGGYYAARQELIEVLRMISHAKDAQQGIPKRTQALAYGLRALEEAEDFAPRGIQLEADLMIDVLCASHRTPIAKQMKFEDVLPHQMMNGYFRYAQLKLADAVTGEPAGSMALHALGKLATQLGQVEPEKHRLSQRRAIAFQQAALLAHDQNHLAAHELATLLADAGHFAEAEKLLQQVASRDPNAVVLRNLSLMQEKLGLSRQSIANLAIANQLSQQGASGTNNVQWVSPQAFSRASGIAPGVPRIAAHPVIQQPRVPAPYPPSTQPTRR